MAARSASAKLRERFYHLDGWSSIFETLHSVRRFEDVLVDIAQDSSEINRLAKSQAQDMVANAENAAREMRRHSDEYAREVLQAIENHLAKVMGTLQKGREKLDVRISAQQESEPVIPVGRGVRR